MTDFFANLSLLLADLPPASDPIVYVQQERPMSTQLKIKIASLAAEAVIIRRIERKLARVLAHKNRPKGLDPVWFSIQRHRRHEVRDETRHSHLAQMFLRGRHYVEVEAFCWDRPSLKRVHDIAKRFAPADMADFGQRWTAWEQDAKAHLKGVAVEEQDRAKKAFKKRVERAKRYAAETPEQREARRKAALDNYLANSPF